MQGELQKGGAALDVRLLGVNGVGYASGNATICQGRSIPWLQDEADVNAWQLWEVTYRDVIILDAENQVVGVYNLTEHDLGNPDNYAELEQLLNDIASGAGRPMP
jgi:hypothetical protein